MAGDWIKIQVSLPDKPETWQMAGMLSMSADEVVGKLVRVWAWFDAHTADGHALGVTFALVDRIAGRDGFAESMSLCGWLEQSGSDLFLPNFDRHNGDSAKKRALATDRKRLSRNTSPPVSQEMSRKQSDKSVTREEKRREEKEHGASPNGSRLQPDWVVPADWLSWARSEHAGVDALAEAEKFRDHWLAQPGAKGRKSDWQATWRNWIRKSAEYAGRSRPATYGGGYKPLPGEI